MTVLFGDARHQIGKVDYLSIDRFDHDPTGFLPYIDGLVG
jgi:hypothetical protein